VPQSSMETCSMNFGEKNPFYELRWTRAAAFPGFRTGYLRVTTKAAGRRSNGGGTVRRLVSAKSHSPHRGWLNTVGTSENSVIAKFAEFIFHTLG
jgi:hypothetical protein